MTYQPMPGAPQQPPPSRGAPPSTVRTAVLLMFISAGLSFIATITEFALKDQIRDQIANNNPGADTGRLDDLLTTAITIAVAVSAVLLVLYLLLAIQVRKGKNWARIVTWVFAGLGTLSLVGAIAGTEPTVNRVLGVLGGIINIALIILLARPPSNAYFRKPPPYEPAYYPQYPPQGQR